MARRRSKYYIAFFLGFYYRYMNFVTGFGFTTGCAGGARGMCDFTTAAWCERADRQQLRFDSASGD
jgi:hypothetical protein